MADSILRLRVSSEEYDNKLKRATEQLTRYADGCRKAGGTLQYVDDNVVEFTRSLGRMETTATTARGKVSELTKAYTELAVQYKNMTDEEKKLWYQFLKKLPLTVNRQKNIGNYIVDFYCAKARLVIELDGGGHYTTQQAETDQLRTNELEGMQLTVLRFCNLDIDRNFSGVCEYIDLAVKNLSLSQLR